MPSSVYAAPRRGSIGGWFSWVTSGCHRCLGAGGRRAVPGGRGLAAGVPRLVVISSLAVTRPDSLGYKFTNIFGAPRLYRRPALHTRARTLSRHWGTWPTPLLTTPRVTPLLLRTVRFAARVPAQESSRSCLSPTRVCAQPTPPPHTTTVTLHQSRRQTEEGGTGSAQFPSCILPA